jgi:hypothetical protein
MQAVLQNFIPGGHRSFLTQMASPLVTSHLSPAGQLPRRLPRSARGFGAIREDVGFGRRDGDTQALRFAVRFASPFTLRNQLVRCVHDVLLAERPGETE